VDYNYINQSYEHVVNLLKDIGYSMEFINMIMSNAVTYNVACTGIDGGYDDNQHMFFNPILVDESKDMWEKRWTHPELAIYRIGINKYQVIAVHIINQNWRFVEDGFGQILTKDDYDNFYQTSVALAYANDKLYHETHEVE
jgi:hypothetical protein